MEKMRFQMVALMVALMVNMTAHAKKNVGENVTNAMDTASSCLTIVQVVRPDTLIAERIEAEPFVSVPVHLHRLIPDANRTDLTAPFLLGRKGRPSSLQGDHRFRPSVEPLGTEALPHQSRNKNRRNGMCF